MPPSTQAKLLRTLQNQEVTRVGSVAPRKVDIRVIAATNRSVQELIAQKLFREDLYYRLAMVELRTPSLVDRREDLPLLASFLLDRFANQFNKNIRGITQEAQSILALHSWPGNIRELENALGHACMLATGDVIDVEHLPRSLRNSERVPQAAAGSRDELAHPTESAISFDGHERLLLVNSLARAGGNQSEASRVLQITRDRLRGKMAKHGLLSQPESAPAVA
jgi:DNA-binding NtrC family response regulator